VRRVGLAPYLALSKGCRVTGLDYEPSAVELAEANIRGAGAPGRDLYHFGNG
jgi:methylase of polypeptide subunit release factors